MMFILLLFEKLFIIAFTLSRLCVLLNKDYHSGHNYQIRNNAAGSVHLTIETIEVVTACVLCAVGITVVGFRFYDIPLGRVVISLAVAVVQLEWFVESVLAVGTVSALVRSDSEGIITIKDRFAIDAVSYVVFYQAVFQFSKKLIEIVGRIENVFYADICQLLIYVALVFLYLFLSSIHLLVPLTESAHLLQKVNQCFQRKTRIYQIGNICIGFLNKRRYCEPLLRKYSRLYKSKKLLFIVLLAIPLPIIFMADVIWLVIRAFYRILLSIIGFTALILKLFKKAIGKIIIKSRILAERRMVAILFRASLLATIVIVVCWNRYYPFGRRVNESTAILEFLGSAVAIPTVFKWNYAGR